jgi:hypothetical protein
VIAVGGRANGGPAFIDHQMNDVVMFSGRRHGGPGICRKPEPPCRRLLNGGVTASTSSGLKISNPYDKVPL